MIQYEGEFMENVVLSSLCARERPLILVTHDESCFSSHDGCDYVWLDKNNMPIRPKNDGCFASSWSRRSFVSVMAYGN
jgi:hypothetical protein